MENRKGQKFVASYSGGKDSMLAIYRAIRLGMEPVRLITTYNTDLSRSWFHGIPDPVLQAVSHSLRIPVQLIRTSWQDYRENFLAQLKQDRQDGAEVCVFGDIDIEEHLEWCSGVCRDAGMEALFPLWHESRADLVRESISLGFQANITVVDTSRLSDRHLGHVLTEDTIRAIQSEGADICGENGEYHTFVSDGPIFSSPIPFSFGEKLIRGNYAVLPLLPKETK